MRKTLFEQQQQETEIIIEELLNDGSDPDAIYVIEHHLSSTDAELLEKAAAEAFKLGYDVTETELFEDENVTLYCLDIVCENPLDVDIILEQIKQLIQLSEKYHLYYDGWGTYFEEENSQEDDKDNTDKSSIN